MHKVVDGAVGSRFSKPWRPRALSVWPIMIPGRAFLQQENPIKTMPEFKGMKLRVQQSDVAIAMVKAMGANPTLCLREKSITRSRQA